MNFVWLVLWDTYLEHGGGFVVPVLSAIEVLGRTTRNMKSAAYTRGRNIKTEHVGTMAIFFALSVSYYYTCVRVRSTFSFFVPFCFFSLLSCMFGRDRFYVTQARAEKHERITLSLEVLQENDAKWKREKKLTTRVPKARF